MPHFQLKSFQFLPVVVLAVLFSGLSPAHAAAESIAISGAGATFPYPIYSKWFSEFKKANPTVEINYQSIGSGGGIRQLMDKTVDFGASDAPMTDEQLSKSSMPVIHIPTVMGAVVMTYNLPEVKETLKLSSDVIADMFLGKITKWNDERLVKLNPTAKLPDTAILIAHRSDGSGTTAVFADYLSKISPEWKEKVGSGTALNWPVGLGGKGNEGVTGVVKQTPGAIGYVELTYAESNKLAFATLRNKSGQFVTASPKSVTAAAAGAMKDMPKDFRVSITDSSDKAAYPIASFTYLLVYQNMDAKKGNPLIQFMTWAIHDGQKMAEPLAYAPLPKQMIGLIEKRMKEIKTQ